LWGSCFFGWLFATSEVVSIFSFLLHRYSLLWSCRIEQSYVFPWPKTKVLESMIISRFICLTSPIHKGLGWELSLLWDDEVRVHWVQKSSLRKPRLHIFYSTFGCIRMILVNTHKRWPERLISISSALTLLMILGNNLCWFGSSMCEFWG